MKKYLLAAAIVLSSSRVFAADSLSAARELYASASYEDALAMLGRLNAAELPPDQGRTADQYRALCLLALGKSAEASQAIEAVVAADPSFHPSDSDVSPRVRAVFSEVRKRLLPGLVQQKYAIAKTAYDHKDYAAASNGFGQLLALYADPDLAHAANKPPLSDLRVLIDGFHSLSVQAAAPPPASEPAALAAKAAVVPRPAPVVAAPEPPKIYTSGDANVVPPVTIRQELPPFSGVVQRAMTGAMEVMIDETGKVVSAAMRSPTVANYDRQAVAAAQSWRYRPATLNGTPVKYRKLIQVAVTPQ
jgi:TonB family protein